MVSERHTTRHRFSPRDSIFIDDQITERFNFTKKYKPRVTHTFWSTGCTRVDDTEVDVLLSKCMRKKHFTIASLSTLDQPTIDRIRQVQKDLDLELKFVQTIPELYPLFSDPKFVTDAIGIDIDTIYNTEGLSAWDIVNTLDTIIKSTVCRDGPGKPQKRNTKIIAGATLQTPVEHIKDILLIDKVTGIYPKGEGFTLEEKELAMKELLDGVHHIPKKIQQLMKPKKTNNTVKQKSSIKLTPRQEQILHLIQERGASNKVIAKTLNITESTVKLHVGLVLKKFGVRNRTQLAVYSKK